MLKRAWRHWFWAMSTGALDYRPAPSPPPASSPARPAKATDADADADAAAAAAAAAAPGAAAPSAVQTTATALAALEQQLEESGQLTEREAQLKAELRAAVAPGHRNFTRQHTTLVNFGDTSLMDSYETT